MINLRIQNQDVKQPALAPRITVVGVGGAGGNAVGNMISSGLEGVEFLVCNTDAQALAGSNAPKKIQLGKDVTGGLGAGAKPDVGRAAAEESINDIMDYVDGSNMVFITSGMGGGTGTGVSPVLAKACKEAGILTVGVVTKPFHFEGTTRMKAAEDGIREMQQYVDALIVIPNQNLFRIATDKTTFGDAFKMADSVLQSAVRGVTDLIVRPGDVNLDFNDLKTTMTQMGKAMMGTGEATGDRRAVMAAEAAINNPLLDDVTMKGAKGLIINITGGRDVTLFEIDEACNRIKEEVDPEANIIFGTSFDGDLNGVMRVTVIATGIETEAERKSREDTQKGKRGGGDTRGFSMAQPRATQPQSYATTAAFEPVREQRAAAPVATTTAPAQQAASESYVQGQAFIPPVPVDPDLTASAQNDTVSYSRIVTGVAQPKQVSDEVYASAAAASEPAYAPEPEPEMVAAPTPAPVMVAPASAPAPAPAPVDLVIPASIVPTHTSHRAPAASGTEPALSLFQRITNRVRATVESAFEDQSQPYDPYDAPLAREPRRGGAATAPAVTSQPLPAASRDPVDVARVAKAAPSSQAELDLEIPAFLRRQAS